MMETLYLCWTVKAAFTENEKYAFSQIVLLCASDFQQEFI